ncbi:MAG: redoxin domain-containing protein, partial [Verrucomicrobiales bacterium]|nr:redoxin domain-containing protein [Verrucomicrobiales bacterium]
LKRFDDAAWQQAASSCVDHAYMIRQLLPPDRIHNYAHNEEWLVRTYNELGRAKDALALARSLVAVPRYPDLNTLDKANTSASYGRTRLIETLVKWELWSELRRLSATPWLSAADAPPAHQVTLQRALASAAFAEKDAAALRRAIAELEKLQPKAKTTAETKSKVGKAAELTPPAPATETRKALPANAAAKAAQKTAQAAKSDAPPAAPPQTKPSAPAPKKDLAAAPAPDATKKLTPAPDTSAKPKAEPKKKKPEPAVVALQEARALLQVLEKKPDAAEALLAAEYLDATERVRALLHLGRKEDAVKQIEKLPQDLLGQIIRAHTAWQGGDRALAESAFKKAHDLAYAMDTDLPAARRLFQLAYKLKHGGKWRADPPVRDDLGERPAFDRLGPLHWHPPTAPMLKLEPVSDSPPDLHAAQPRLLLFYLGAGCSHCVEQLDAFAKTAEAWKKAGITVHAAAPGTQAEVTQTWDVVESGKNLPFPIWRDPTGETFKAWRAWDDFEKMPLHATILLDAENRVRWLDISWQPFMDAAFLLKEAQRLLSLDEVDQFTALPTSDDAKQVVSSANR